MKLSGRDLTRFIARPEPDRAGLLLYGDDAMRVALKRQDLLKALVGPKADEEMRLTRMGAGELRKSAAPVIDALKARGFFPGPCAVFVEEAGDAAAEALTLALTDWRPGDATLVVTAGALGKTSKLRKAFESHPNAYAAAIYDDPPDRAEIEESLRKRGLAQIPREAMDDLTALATQLDPGDFRQLVEKIGLYKLNDPAPLTPSEIAALAPASTEAAVDDMIHAVAEARADAIAPVMARLAAQGVGAVTLCIAATRHFRQLYTAASDPRGIQQGIANQRPPVFWKARDRMARQAQAWGAERLAAALGMLTETDLTLRSAARAPEMALMERTLVRLAMMPRSRG